MRGKVVPNAFRGVLKHRNFKKFNVHVSTASFTVKKKAGKPGFPVGEMG